MNKEKVLNLLGLAHRAGKVVSGDFVVEKAIKAKTVTLLLLASDAAKNNEDKFINLADKLSIPVKRVATKEELGSAIGKEMRVVIGITDDGFGKPIIQLINQE